MSFINSLTIDPRSGGCTDSMTSSSKSEELDNCSYSGIPASRVASLTTFQRTLAVLSISGSNGINGDPELPYTNRKYLSNTMINKKLKIKIRKTKNKNKTIAQTSPC